MTAGNEKRTDEIISILLGQFERLHTQMSFDHQLILAQTIESLEKAKAAEKLKTCYKEEL